MLITAGVDPTDVQGALRHASLRITLETYVHWWPKKNRLGNVVGSALRDASLSRGAVRGALRRRRSFCGLAPTHAGRRAPSERPWHQARNVD
jgi:hypothetical protein